MYQVDGNRYESMLYARCGNRGLKFPFLSLGLWHNFGGDDSYTRARELILGSFDLGITHFDMANNYGPPSGSAEETFAKVLKSDLRSHRNELVLSTKAGYYMWPGPYGEYNSRKNLIASLDASLQRLGVDYVDIFYSHRPDHETPIEETAAAMADMVRQGKALYVGISNYYGEESEQAIRMLEKEGVSCLINQTPYSMFDRRPEESTFEGLEKEGVGAIAFMTLAQGILSEKYFHGIPDGSRAGGKSKFLLPEHITAEKIEKAKKLNEIASRRGQTLSQMAIAWAYRQPVVCSVLIGASSMEQIRENMKASGNLDFSEEELTAIDRVLDGGEV